MIESHRLAGPQARELFIRCRPPAGVSGARDQATAVYSAISSALGNERASLGCVVSETVFARHLQADIGEIRAARVEAFTAGGETEPLHAISEIEQPPIGEEVDLEVCVHAVVPNQARLQVDLISAESRCSCGECDPARAYAVQLGAERRLYAGGVFGTGEDAFEQTFSMFVQAEALLEQAGMDFHDVVRTWIHLRDIGRDYDAFNRARREFFQSRGIDPVPASTGIGGGASATAHPVCLGFQAVRSETRVERAPISAPTLNEAPQYGADFVRGMRVEERNKVALHISGTASVDEAGRTAHVDDFDAQADRMLVNIAALLEGQGASFRDVVSAISYVKEAGNASRLEAKFREAGFVGFPNPIVIATVCRPDLLCETEALAVLGRAAADPDLDA